MNVMVTPARSSASGTGRLRRLSTRTHWHLRQCQAAQDANVMQARCKKPDGGQNTPRVLALWDARILMMSVGAWVTVLTIGLQVLIWVFTPDVLEDWCEGCAFGPQDKRKGWTPKQQMDEFDKALVEVL